VSGRYPVDFLLSLAAETLNTAAAGEQPTKRVSDALRLLLAVAEHPDVCAASAEHVAQAGAALDVAYPAVVADTEGELTSCHVAHCMGQARGLLDLFGRPPEELQAYRDIFPRILDRLDYAALIASQLEGLDRVRHIEARGNHQAEGLAMQLGLTPDVPADVVIH
jgi:hypothetical protein